MQSYKKYLIFKRKSEKKFVFSFFLCIFAPLFYKIGQKMTLYSQNFYRLLYDWYEANHRILPWRETENPYYIWLSEIILQQTRVVQGMDYYHRFVTTYPTIEMLAAAAEDDVLRLWQGLGYYSRARNLHRAAQMIVGNQASSIRQNTSDNSNYTSEIRFPKTFNELRSLPGVGDYTAGAIASFAYNLPYPALDGNVYRVLARLNDCEMAFDTSAGKKYFHGLAEQLLDKANPRLFNSAIMEFGALYCLPQSPDCTNCPIQAFCKAYAAGTVDLLPVRKPRPTLRNRYFTYTIYITPDNKTLIHQRSAKDIWQHLYEFPLIEHSSEEKWQKYKMHGARALPSLTHILSHQRLHARFYVMPVNELPILPDSFAITWEELDNYALARLTLKALEAVNRLP